MKIIKAFIVMVLAPLSSCYLEVDRDVSNIMNKSESEILNLIIENRNIAEGDRRKLTAATAIILKSKNARGQFECSYLKLSDHQWNIEKTTTSERKCGRWILTSTENELSINIKQIGVDFFGLSIAGSHYHLRNGSLFKIADAAD